MVDPTPLVQGAQQVAAQAEAAALNFGQKWWWAFTAGALVAGFVLGLAA